MNDRKVFERNKNGHFVLTINGLDLTGAEEIARLEAAGCHASDWVKSCLLSTEEGSYDQRHHLFVRPYRVAFMPVKEIKRKSYRTTENLRERGMGYYTYAKPLAGIIVQIRKTISDKKIRKMGFEYILAPHDPINDSQGGPVLLSSVIYFGGRVLFGNWGMPHLRWTGAGAFVFLERTHT